MINSMYASDEKKFIATADADMNGELVNSGAVPTSVGSVHLQDNMSFEDRRFELTIGG
jgi:hypothetical protein